MIRKIVLENYMSHARTEIEPAAGLTVLIGPNNCGKSAVISALETVARATRGDFMVRHGEKEARVTVETDDGHTIVWRRKGGTVSYVVDGREVHREVPDDLHEHLRLPLVKADRGDYEFDVHFAQQKSPIFLLDEPPSRAATFFSASSDAGRLLEIQDRHRDKVRERKRRKSDLAKEVATLDGELKALDGLDVLAEQAAQLEAGHAEVLEEQATIHALGQALQHLMRLEQALRRTSAEAAALRDLAIPPELEQTAPLENLIERTRAEAHAAAKASEARQAARRLELPPDLVDARPLVELTRRLDVAERDLGHRSARRGALDPLEPAPQLADAPAAAHLVTQLALARRSAARLEQRRAELADLAEPPELADPEPLAAAIAALSRAADGAQRPAVAMATLAALTEPPDETDPAPLAASLAALASSQQSALAARRKAAEAAHALEAVERQVRGWVEAHPDCPICGGPVTAERVLQQHEGGHHHG